MIIVKRINMKNIEKRNLTIKSILVVITLMLLAFAIKSCFFSPKFSYVPYKNGYGIEFCNDCSEVMTFPEEYKGKPVLKIGPLVLMLLKYSITSGNVSSVRIIKIPDSVELISHEAFYGVDNLEECYVGANVREIESSAFSGCTKLTNIYLPNSVKIIDKTSFKDSKELTIYCPAGSYSEKYAIENNIPFIIKN